MNNLNKFEFDFNLGSNFSSNQSKPLKDQKPQSQTSSYSSFSASRPTTTPNKPAWTHQPLPTGLPNQPTSMVGDISGKSWNSIPPSNNNSSLGIGIIPKNPNLFGDLLGSSLGSNKTSNSNAPLKSAAPLGTQSGFKNTFSMGSMGNSLPRTGSGSGSTPVGNLGGAAMKTGGLGPGTGAAKKDPFGSLVDFSSKKEVNLKGSNSGGSGDYSFGDFQNAGKSSTPSVKSPPTYTSNIGSNANTKMDDFGDFEIPIQSTSSQKPATGGDSFDMFFSSSSAAPAAASGAGGVPFSDMDDWNMDSEYAGDEAGSTTELDGLPPPPAGVNVSIAKNKGMDSYKQGQHPDAIKWLTWAVVLLEKAGDSDNAVEVLSCRASCYKEVGEYKKAIADCTKVLEQDGENVAVLTQRALLYESSEKYRLGADDLRTVLKIDPGNRLARSTIHRLNKMAE